MTEKLNLTSQVFFLGLRNDIDQLLKITDIFVHTSKREGLGIAPLEAMASGKPIVTSNVNGINEYSVNGKTGYSLSPEDIRGFANAIDNLYEDKNLRIQMGNHNKRAVSKFSVENSTEKMLTIIEKVLSTE